MALMRIITEGFDYIPSVQHRLGIFERLAQVVLKPV